jgi:hypothetical protein
MSSLGFGGMDEESSVTGNNNMASWRERLRYKLENIEIVKASGKICDIKLGVGSETKIRSLHFSKPRECQSFIKVMEEMKVMERERAQHNAEEYRTSSRLAAAAASSSSPSSSSPMGERQRRSSLPLQPPLSTTPIRKSPLTVKYNLYSIFGGGNHNHDTTSSITRDEQQSLLGREDTAINLLIEIVSASDLPAADIYTSDPYVVVQEASKEIHRTKVISKK